MTTYDTANTTWRADSNQHPDASSATQERPRVTAQVGSDNTAKAASGDSAKPMPAKVTTRQQHQVRTR